MKVFRIRPLTHSLLLAAVLFSCIGCRHLPTLLDNHKSISTEAAIARNSILQPLHSLVALDSDAIESTENVQGMPLSYRDLLFVALVRFRHTSGLHEVRLEESTSAADGEDRLLVLLPPGLNRLEQIEFLLQLEKHVASFRNACHQYVCAKQLDEIAHRESIVLEELSVASQRRFDQKEIGWREMEQVQLLVDQSKSKTLQRSLGQTAVASSDHALRALLAFLESCSSESFCAAEWQPTEPAPPSPTIADPCLSIETPTQNLEYQKTKIEYLMLQRRDRSKTASTRWLKCFQSKKVVSMIPNSAHDIAVNLECQLIDRLRIAKQRALEAEKGSELIAHQIDASKSRTERISLALVAGEATRLDALQAELQSLAFQSNFILHAQYKFTLFDELARLQGSLFSIEQIAFPNCWLQPITMVQAGEITNPETNQPSERFED